MELPKAQNILTAAIRALYEKSQKPILGCQLKPAVVERARIEGEVFDEKALGYKNFLAFVSGCPQVAVSLRASGVDFLAVPVEQAGALAKDLRSPAEFIRQDFWKAFTIFQRPGVRKAYSKTQDQIIIEDDSKPQGANIPITPISKEQQLTWRKEFLGSIQNDTQGQLSAALEASDPFREFNVVLSRNLGLFKSWHSYKVQKVRTIIQAWAELNKIPNEIWLVSPKPHLRADSRSDLYAFLDQLPIERILEIEIPIGWVLEARHKNKMDR